MEGKSNQEQEISFEEQIKSAKELLAAVDVRNNFVNAHGGFDDFADIHQHVGGNREEYDNLWQIYMDARNKFDRAVKDKNGFVARLRNMNFYELADRISTMFNVK